MTRDVFHRVQQALFATASVSGTSVITSQCVRLVASQGTEQGEHVEHNRVTRQQQQGRSRTRIVNIFVDEANKVLALLLTVDFTFILCICGGGARLY